VKRLALALMLVSRIALAQSGADPEPLPSTPQMELPHFQETDRVALPPLPVSPASREPDRRPLLVGGGIVLIAVAFWLNRRNRDRYEREDAHDDEGKAGKDEETR
jgi:hypothetical protein